MGTVARSALSIGAAALFAGCGGSASPPVGAPGALAQSRVTVKSAVRRGSWMLPEAKTDALLYYSDGAESVFILSYPQGKVVGMLQGFYGSNGVCSDASGNVFVTTGGTETVVEYAHGGTEPIATLGDFGYYPFGCAVDPLTGNLAVANLGAFNGYAGTVAIYNGAKGKPTDYTAQGFSRYEWCAYDGSGNLFVDGDAGLTELPYGQQNFTNIALSVSGQGLQWDGQYLAMVNPSSRVIYRIAVSGSSGTIAQTVTFTGLITSLANDFVFSGSKVVMPYATQNYVNRIGLWRYPKAKHLQKMLHKVDGLQAITLSN
jgi:hypothetical protein